MKSLHHIPYSPHLATLAAETRELQEQDSLIVNKIISNLLGIFPSMSNTTYQSALTEYKKQLTTALQETRKPVTPQQLKQAFTQLRQNGGTFQPSVPEFIKLCLKSNRSNAPEHRWINPATLLPKHSHNDIKSFAQEAMKKIRNKQFGTK